MQPGTLVLKKAKTIVPVIPCPPRPDLCVRAPRAYFAVYPYHSQSFRSRNLARKLSAGDINRYRPGVLLRPIFSVFPFPHASTGLGRDRQAFFPRRTPAPQILAENEFELCGDFSYSAGRTRRRCFRWNESLLTAVFFFKSPGDPDSLEVDPGFSEKPACK